MSYESFIHRVTQQAMRRGQAQRDNQAPPEEHSCREQCPDCNGNGYQPGGRVECLRCGGNDYLGLHRWCKTRVAVVRGITVVEYQCRDCGERKVE